MHTPRLYASSVVVVVVQGSVPVFGSTCKQAPSIDPVLEMFRGLVGIAECRFDALVSHDLLDAPGRPRPRCDGRMPERVPAHPLNPRLPQPRLKGASF